MPSEKGHPETAPLFGVAAEFTSASALLDAVRTVAPRRFGRLDTHSPIPLREIGEILDTGRATLPTVAVVGGLVGFIGTMGMCIYATAYSYVFDIGGRPLISWQSFMVPSLSAATLVGALAVYLAMLFTNRLPRLNHPAFNIPNFSRASQDRFFLTIEPRGKDLDVEAITRTLQALPHPPVALSEVPR